MSNEEIIKLKQKLQQLNEKAKDLLEEFISEDIQLKSFIRNEASDSFDSLTELSDYLSFLKDKDDQDG